MPLPDPALNPSQATRVATVERWFAGARPKTVLVGDSRAALWPKDLAKQVGRGVANLAISLTQTQDHIRQIQQTAIDLSGARTVVVISGFNNLNRTPGTPESIAQGVAQLVGLLRAKAPNAVCLVFEVFAARPGHPGAPGRYYSEERRAALNQALAALAGPVGFTLVDTGLTDPADPELYEDGAHLTRLAYERYLTPAAQAALAKLRA